MTGAASRAAARPPFGWARAARAGLSFRPIAEADLPFLERVYASTRAEELAQTGWPQARVDAFLAMQFRAQHAHYQRHYPEADWLVVERAAAGAERRGVGRLYVERWPSQHRIIDVALLPEHRGGGLGTALLRDLIDEASAAGKAVSIHVEKANPALRLYARLGFARVEDKGVYDLMRREPG